jgi:hypothetical protein
MDVRLSVWLWSSIGLRCVISPSIRDTKFVLVFTQNVTGEQEKAKREWGGGW